MSLTSIISSVISRQVELEALAGFHIESITVSQNLDRTPLLEQFDCSVYASSDLKINEFCLSVRSSPSNRRVEFFRVHPKKAPTNAQV